MRAYILLAVGVASAFGLAAAPLNGEEQPPAAATVDGPLSTEQALASFQFEPGLRIEIVAAEPLVESPVALAFDEHGRLFVAENRGYPTGPDNLGRIALLEDMDSDGKYDKRSTFADGLSYPNGLMPWRDGLIVTCAPDLLHLQDTDNDGKADRRTVLFTGFATTGSTQLRASHPMLGLDNWIYITGGLSGGKVVAPDLPERPAIEFTRADFRFRPDRSQFEVADGGAQFGQTFDDFGRRFICYNRVQVQHVVLPSRYLRRNPHLVFSTVVENCPAEMAAEPLRGHGAAARLFPISKNVTTADSHAGTFTAACATTIFNGSSLTEKYRGAVFSCDPTANLVHVDWLKQNGATFSAHRAPMPTEFLSSNDNWFRPVFLANGPDGALYVCDMYRQTIEHPDYLPPEIRKHTDFDGGKGMGRIYRVSATARPSDLRKSRSVAMHNARTDELCATLSHVDGWRRETARRLLVDRNDRAAALLLRALLPARESHPIYVVGRLRALEQLDALDDALLLSILDHRAGEIRENAIQIAEPRLASSPSLLERVLELADDPDPRVRFQAALSLGEVSDPRSVPALAKTLKRDAGDRWTRAAVFSSVAGRELELLQALSNSNGAVANVDLFSELGRLVGAATKPAGQTAAVRSALQLVRSQEFAAQASLLSGLAEAMRSQASGAGNQLQTSVQGQGGDVRDAVFLAELFEKALQTAADSHAAVELRCAALSLLADGTASSVGHVILELVETKQPPEVQLAAVRTIRGLRDPQLAANVLSSDRFASYSPSLREEVLSTMLSQPLYLPLLLTAIESAAVPVGVVDSLRRNQLTNHSDPAIRDRAAKVFATSAVGDRLKVYEEYKSVVQLAADANNGHKVFVKQCANCHRLDREGVAVGPDLFGMRTQPKEAILLHLLIPEFEITPNFSAYVIETTDGRVLAGLLAAETATQVTLRQALGKEETVLRSDIETMALSKLSLMPQELEKSMTRQELADLLAYLKGERGN